MPSLRAQNYLNDTAAYAAAFTASTAELYRVCELSDPAAAELAAALAAAGTRTLEVDGFLCIAKSFATVDGAVFSKLPAEGS